MEKVLGDSKELEIYFKHYSDLFIYQARQRLDAIRFFFVGYAILVNAITSTSITEGVRACLLLAGGCVAIVFLRLDFRNAQIVEIDEKPLKDLQRFAQSRLGCGNSWQTFKRCDVEKQGLTTYSHLVPALYAIAWFGSFTFFGITLHKILLSEGSDCPILYSVSFTIILIVTGLVATFSRPSVTTQPLENSHFGDGDVLVFKEN